MTPEDVEAHPNADLRKQLEDYVGRYSGMVENEIKLNNQIHSLELQVRELQQDKEGLIAQRDSSWAAHDRVVAEGHEKDRLNDSLQKTIKGLRIQMLRMCPTSVADCRLPSCQACVGPQDQKTEKQDHERGVCDEKTCAECAAYRRESEKRVEGACKECGKPYGGSAVLCDNCLERI